MHLVSKVIAALVCMSLSFVDLLLLLLLLLLRRTWYDVKPSPVSFLRGSQTTRIPTSSKDQKKRNVKPQKKVLVDYLYNEANQPYMVYIITKKKKLRTYNQAKPETHYPASVSPNHGCTAAPQVTVGE